MIPKAKLLSISKVNTTYTMVFFNVFMNGQNKIQYKFSIPSTKSELTGQNMSTTKFIQKSNGMQCQYYKTIYYSFVQTYY